VARLDPPATSGGAPLIYPVLDSGDGATFRIRATYLNQSPTFQNFNAGPMSFSGQPVLLRVASGGLRQVGPDTFQIFRDRIGSNDPPVVMAYQLGDANYRGADRPIQIGHQTTLTSGTPQTVSFPTIPNQVATNLQPVTLSATATSGRPVQYWMVSGPYLIAGGTSVLTPTTPPTRATYPMRVIVGAYQWGTTNAPAVASAPTVYQSFWLYKDAAQQTQYQSSAAASASVTRSATAKAKTTGSSANAAASASASRLAGSYTSLLISPDGTSGKLSLRLRANGAVSGKITTVAGSASFTGKLDATGHLMLSVPNSPLGAITIDVRGGIDSGLQVLSGTVKLADGSYELEPAARAVTATEAGLRPGRYSLTFEPDATQIGSPQTNGWGTASLLASGAMTITGTLADGTAYSVSTQVQADGKAPIYFAPGKLTSGLFGLLQTHDSSPEITGQLTWMKLPATRGPYRDGFVAQISASADTSSPTKQR
jgi:hypothetical protein